MTNKNRNIIMIDGLDNVGKTTQIERLIDALSYLPTHVIKYPKLNNATHEKSMQYSKDLYNNMFRLMNIAYNDLSCNLIFDRSHITEAVYSPLYRKYKGDFVFDIEKIYVNYPFWKNLYLFILKNDPEILLKRDDNKSHSNDLNSKIEEIKMFNKAFENSNIRNKFIIDCTNKSINQITNEILSNIKF
jgi:thymidylate kinase